MIPSSKQAPSSITIRRPDDWHVHLRDGPMLQACAEGITVETVINQMCARLA